MVEELKELFPDLSDEQFEEWKEKYGNLFASPFESNSFLWRQLLRPEYKEVTQNDKSNIFDREEFICDLCVLYPKPYDFSTGPAGVATVLSEQIMDASGFSPKGRPKSF